MRAGAPSQPPLPRGLATGWEVDAPLAAWVPGENSQAVAAAEMQWSCSEETQPSVFYTPEARGQGWGLIVAQPTTPHLHRIEQNPVRTVCWTPVSQPTASTQGLSAGDEHI